MNTIPQIAKHFREVHFGGNWTSVNLKTLLSDVTLEEALTRIDDLNTISVLVFHVNYYVSEVLKVLKGSPLTASDKLSFGPPVIETEEGWTGLVRKTLEDAELFASEIERLDESRLFEDFTDPKYSNYYRNIHGIIEHTHYHLGQISLIKKMLRFRQSMAAD